MHFLLIICFLNPGKFDSIVITNILLAEVGNEVLAHLSGCKELELEINVPSITEKELKSLQYLAGFVIHKLYIKFRFSKNSASVFNQHCSQILHACKVDTDESQTLVEARDRGGLWKVNKKFQAVFLESEKYFREQTSKVLSNLSCQHMVQESMKNVMIISNFNAVVLSVDMVVTKEFRMNLLEHILTLYFRVRSFSFAKDIREKHKADKKASRKRSLRTEITRASSSTDEGH